MNRPGATATSNYGWDTPHGLLSRLDRDQESVRGPQDRDQQRHGRTDNPFERVVHRHLRPYGHLPWRRPYTKS